MIVHRNLKVQSRNKIEPLNKPLNKMQIQLLKLIEINPEISYQRLSESLNKGRSTIMRQIQALKDLGILERVGPKKSGCWEIKGSSISML